MKNRKTSFVTCRNIHGPLVELREYASLSRPETIVDVDLYTETSLNLDAMHLKTTQEEEVKDMENTRCRTFGGKCSYSKWRIGSLCSKGFKNLKDPRQTCGRKRKINENHCDESILDQDMICSDMAKWIVKCNVPLSTIKHESFNSFLNQLQPRFDLKSFLHDWSESPKGITFGKEAAFGEVLTQGPRARSKDLRASLVSPFAYAELKLLKDWTSKKYGLDTPLPGHRDVGLASLLIPINDNVKELPNLMFFLRPMVLYYFFELLEQRSEKFPKKYLKHWSFHANTTACMLISNFRKPSWHIRKTSSDACKIFVPIYISHHWILLCVDLKDEKLVWLDPLKSSQMFHDFESGVVSEWLRLYVLPDLGYKSASNWPLIVWTDIPTGKKIDSDIFVMKYADCLTQGNDFPFSEQDVPHFRKRICLDIYNKRMKIPRISRKKS